MAKASFARETVAYANQARAFEAKDWLAYMAWVGLMVGLFCAIAGFLAVGRAHGVTFPEYVWNVPIGAGVFVVAIAFDTIGHRTTYREELEKGEALVFRYADVVETLRISFVLIDQFVRRLRRADLVIIDFMILVFGREFRAFGGSIVAAVIETVALPRQT